MAELGIEPKLFYLLAFPEPQSPASNEKQFL